LNRNRHNYYEEVQALKQTVQNQRLIIARLERDVNTKIMTVDILTRQLSALHSVSTADLLDL
jgi:sensor domain CHASE-containing protein